MPSSPAGKAVIELSLNDKITRGLRAAENSVKRFSKNISKFGGNLTSISAAILAPLGLSVKSFADLDDQIRLLSAVSGANESEVNRLTDRIETLGATTSFTASQVAEAAVALARAGFSPKEIDATLESMLALSRATGQDLARSTDVAANTLRAFGLEASEIGRVADILTAGANKSNQTLDDLGEGLKFVAPVAAEAGFSLEEMVASLGILANSGIKASTASTALKNAIVKLSSGTVQKKLEDLGVPFKDAQGNFLAFDNIIANLAKRVKNFPAPKRLEILSDIFDLRAGPGASVLSRNLDQVIKLQSEFNNVSGLAIRTAEEMEAGIGGTIRRVISAFEGFFNMVGRAASPVFTKLGAQVIGALEALRNLAKENPGLITGIATIGIVAGVAGAAILALGGSVAILGFGLSGITTVVTAVIGILGALKTAFIVVGGAVLSAIISPTGIVLALLATLAQYFFNVLDAAKELKDTIIKDLGGAFDLIKRTFKGVVDALASGDLALAGKIAVTGLKAVWLQATDGIRKAWAVLKQNLVITSLEITDAFKHAFELIFRYAEMAFIKIKAKAKELGFNLLAGASELFGDEEAAQGFLILSDESVNEGKNKIDEINKRYDALRKRREEEKNAIGDAAGEIADEAVKKIEDERQQAIYELNRLTNEIRKESSTAKDGKDVAKKEAEKTAGKSTEDIKNTIAASIASSLSSNTVEAFKTIFGNRNPLVNLSRQQLQEQRKTNKNFSKFQSGDIA